LCYNYLYPDKTWSVEARPLESLTVANKAVEAASEKQASDIVLLDTRKVCSFADYFVICSGESTRQIKTIYEEVEHALKKEGVLPHHHEGTLDSGWLLIDFGDVIVHIFASFEREYYQLDELWSEATPLVRIQ
jgi:ribosome-associated protein